MTFRLFVILLFCCSAVFAAGEDLPDDPRLLFNRGAELAASGKMEEAVTVLRQVAVVRDRTIAAKALTLLGQISTASAKQSVSENSVETPEEQRQIIFEHLKSAERSFSESLLLLPNDEVRHHLETLRAWRNNMTRLWEEYDREQHRNAELQQRIQWLADWEKILTEKVRPLTEESDSPRKFQAGYEAGREQKKLAEELTMLQNVPVSDEKLKEQWEHLPEIQRIADEAAELLSQHQLNEVLPKQQQVLDYLQSLLKQEQNQQSQDQQEQNKSNENQEQQDQKKQEQDQEQKNDQQQNQQPKPEKQEKEGEQKQEMNQQQPPSQKEAAQKKEEEAKEKAERLLQQVRRKEQAAEKRREELRVLQMQAEPVEKDW